MPVGPPNWWLLNRMVQLTNNTLETIERSDRRVLGNILNNDNTISGSNSFTGDNVFTGDNLFTGDNTFQGNGDFNTLEAEYIESQLIQSQSVSLNTINYSPVVYEVPWISNDINGTFIITYNNDTLQLTINNPEVFPSATNPSEYLVGVIGIADINDLVGLTITLTDYTNSSLAQESNPLNATFNIIGINTDVDFILEIELDSSLPNTSYDFGDHTFEGTIVLTAVINSNEIDVNTNLNLSENNISANLGNFTNVVIDGNLSGNTQLNIEGNLVINGETTFNGNIISNNTLNIESNVSINNSLTVNDASTFNQTLNIKKGGITLGNLSTFNGNVIFNGNVRFDGGITESFREAITANANYIVLNANIREQSFDFTYPAGIVIETHDEIHPRGYLFFDLSADRFWDLSGDNLSGNILQANTLRGNTIESAGTDKITFNSNIAVPFLFGNVTGNTATFTGNVRVEGGGYFIGDGSKLTNLNDNLTGWLDASFNYVDVSGNLSVLLSLNGNSAYFKSNVTAANFIGDLSGNVTGHVTGDVTGTVSSLSNHNTDDLTEGSSNLYYTVDRVRSVVSGESGVTYNQSSGVFSIGQSVETTANVNFGNVTATNFIGDLSGNVTGYVTGTVSSLSNHNTDDLTEGSSNLYYTVDRVRSVVSGESGVTYNQSSGVFSIGQSVETTANVNFGNVTAENFIGDLQGNITGSQYVHVTASQFIMESSNSFLTKPLTIQNSGEVTTDNGKLNIDSTGNVTAANFFGNLNGDNININSTNKLAITTGETTITATSGNIELTNTGDNTIISTITGNIQLMNTDGDIELTNVLGNISISTISGNISLNAPSKDINFTSQEFIIDSSNLSVDSSGNVTATKLNVAGFNFYNGNIRSSQDNTYIVVDGGNLGIGADGGNVIVYADEYINILPHEGINIDTSGSITTKSIGSNKISAGLGLTLETIGVSADIDISSNNNININSTNKLAITTGETTITATSGNIELTNTGDNTIISTITGNIQLMNTDGDIELTNVLGNISISTLSGNISLNAPSKDINFTSQEFIIDSSNLSVDSTGNVTASNFFGNLNGDNININSTNKLAITTGETTITATSGNIELTNTEDDTIISTITGKIQLMNTDGDIELTNIQGNMSLSTISGNISLNAPSKDINFTSQEFIIDSSNLSVDSTGNVTASNFFGNLNGDILADGDITISNNNTGNVRIDANNILVSGTHEFSIIHSGNISLSPLIGDINLNPLNGDVDIIPIFGNINVNAGVGNINMSKAPIINSTGITGNVGGVNTNITGRMVDNGNSWYPLMYNKNTGEIRYGPPPYP